MTASRQKRSIEKCYIHITLWSWSNQSLIIVIIPSTYTYYFIISKWKMDVCSTPWPSRMELFVSINDWKLSDIVTKSSMFDWAVFSELSPLTTNQASTWVFQRCIRTQLNIYDGVFFCKNSLQFLVVNYFCKKSSIVDVQRGAKPACLCSTKH